MTAAKNAPDMLGTSVAGLVALLRVENAKMHEDAIARGTRSGGERRRHQTEWFKTRETKSTAHNKAEAIETQAAHGAWSALRDLVVTVRTTKAGAEAGLSYFLAATEEFERMIYADRFCFHSLAQSRHRGRSARCLSVSAAR